MSDQKITQSGVSGMTLLLEGDQTPKFVERLQPGVVIRIANQTGKITQVQKLEGELLQIEIADNETGNLSYFITGDDISFGQDNAYSLEEITILPQELRQDNTLANLTENPEIPTTQLERHQGLDQIKAYTATATHLSEAQVEFLRTHEFGKDDSLEVIHNDDNTRTLTIGSHPVSFTVTP